MMAGGETIQVDSIRDSSSEMILRYFKHGLPLSIFTSFILQVMSIISILLGTGFLILSSNIDFPFPENPPLPLIGLSLISIVFALISVIVLLYGHLQTYLLAHIWQVDEISSPLHRIGIGFVTFIILIICHSITLPVSYSGLFGIPMYLLLILLVYPLIDGCIASKLLRFA